MTNIPFLDGPALEAARVSTIDAIAAIETGLAALGRGDAQQPPPPALSPAKGAFFQPLTAALPARNRASVNWLSYHPGNVSIGLPHSGGVLVLNDFTTGEPLCIMDGIWVSHRRTGYIAALGAKYLAGAYDDIALIGPGAIAEFAVEALSALGLITAGLRVCGRRRETADAFCAKMGAMHGVKATSIADPRVALAGARLVVTATSHEGAPFVERDWVAPGALLILIDRLRLLKPALVGAAGRIVTNSRDSLARWGVEADSARVESFPEIVAAGRRVPVAEDAVALYDAGGLAVADLAFADLLWNRIAAQRHDETKP
jgi:alanine dehydrogenase